MAGRTIVSQQHYCFQMVQERNATPHRNAVSDSQSFECGCEGTAGFDKREEILKQKREHLLPFYMVTIKD